MVATAATYALKGAGGRLGVIALNKALFYSDLVALRDFGATITGSRYLALPMGPMIASYERNLVGELEERKWAAQAEVGMGEPLVLLINPTSELTADQVELLEEAGGWASNRIATQLSTFSHQNIGWITARRQSLELNGQAQPINMGLALQQLMDADDDHEDDPWLVEPEAAGEFDVVGAAPWE